MSDETEPIPGLLPPSPRALSANQVVSYNLMRARKAAGMSQQDVAGVLEQLTGRSWSNASVSAAERAWQGGRPRRFDAAEILAMCQLFNEPIAFFFLPPSSDEYSGEFVGTREFTHDQPDLRMNDDILSAVPTRRYVEIVGLTDPTAGFLMRIQNLYKKWLKSEWVKPDAKYLGKVQTFWGDEDVDWTEVEEAAEAQQRVRSEEVERGLSSEQKDAFLKGRAKDLAMEIAKNLDEMGFLRRDVAGGWGPSQQSETPEDPPF